MKHCNGCNKDLPETEFHEGKSRCKKCRSKENSEYRRMNLFKVEKSITNSKSKKEKEGQFKTDGAIRKTLMSATAIESFQNSEYEGPNLSRYQSIYKNL